MKKCLVGLLCLGMAVTATLGDLSYPAPLPVNWAGGSGYTTAKIKAMPGWNAVGLGTPYTGAGASAKFDHAGDSITVYIDGAPGTLTSGARRSDGAALTAPFLATIKESPDNATWSLVRAFDGSELNGTIQTFQDTLQSSTRYVKYEYETKPTGQNFGLASVHITSGGPAVFTVVLDKANGFTVEQGTNAVIEAEALNGVAPIDYVWTTDMAAGDYTTYADGFNIKATAALGTYYATVTATDSSSPAQTASNTVTFSVVAPAVKYPIAITTPTNGTVTTTPATEAAANTTVTINATPADGYAVGTITVTAADTSNVPVAGNTFTMPAQGVTLNVTFVEYTAPDMLITFENKTLPGAYAPNTALLEDGKVWSTDRVVNGGLLNDKVIGVYSARLYPATGSNAVLQLTEAYPDSISRISYWVASYGSDNMANVTLTVEVSTNGLEWTSVETLAGATDITGTMTERVIETIPENAVYLRFVATAQAASNKRINIDNIAISLGQVVGKPVVVIDGNLSGTVNSQMSLEITLQNAIAADWWFDLKDPDNQPDNSYAWDAGTGVFSFTPSKVGNYTLTATAVDASDIPIANKSVTLTILAAGADVPVPPIVIVPGVGFSFDLPNGYGLARVLGADTVVAGNGFTWTLLSAPTDYEVEGTTVTIKTAPAQRRLFRIYWQ